MGELRWPGEVTDEILALLRQYHREMLEDGIRDPVAGAAMVGLARAVVTAINDKYGLS